MEEDNEYNELPTTGFERYIEQTDEYERAMSALKTPRGRRLKEIADDKHNQIDVDILRTVALRMLEDGIILIESDGQRDNPRLYRNKAMGFMQRVWEEFAHQGDVGSLKERRQDIKEDIESYKQQSGYQSSGELLEAIKDGEVSDIEVETEVFWDIYSPWESSKSKLQIVNFAIENYEVLYKLRDNIDMEVKGAHGDFTDLNAFRAKLGIDDELPTDDTIDEDGVIEREE